MKKLLFVCTGNTCRSPMAEWIFKQKIETKGLDGWEALSAGIGAFDGDAISENSSEVLQQEWGMDAKNHRARRIRSQLIEEVDLILTMTRGHKRSIESSFPEAEGKVFALREYPREGNKNLPDSEVDISDPFGMSYEEYQRVAKEIEEAMDLLIEKLKK